MYVIDKLILIWNTCFNFFNHDSNYLILIKKYRPYKN